MLCVWHSDTSWRRHFSLIHTLLCTVQISVSTCSFSLCRFSVWCCRFGNKKSIWPVKWWLSSHRKCSSGVLSESFRQNTSIGQRQTDRTGKTISCPACKDILMRDNGVVSSKGKVWSLLEENALQLCTPKLPIKPNWMAPWKNRTSRYISFFCLSFNDVLFPMFCLLVEGSVRF